MTYSVHVLCVTQTSMQQTATAQFTRSPLILLYTLPRIPLRSNATTNQQRAMRKAKLVIKRRRNKNRSTKRTNVKSMTTTTRKRTLLSSLSTNRTLSETKKRLNVKERLQRRQKRQSRWKLSSAQWVTGMKMLLRKVTSFRTHYCMKLLYDHLWYFTDSIRINQSKLYVVFLSLWHCTSAAVSLWNYINCITVLHRIILIMAGLDNFDWIHFNMSW